MGRLVAQPGKVKAFHTGSFAFPRWGRLQSRCLKMGGLGGVWRFSTHGSGTGELLRGLGRPWGQRAFTLGGPEAGLTCRKSNLRLLWKVGVSICI